MGLKKSIILVNFIHEISFDSRSGSKLHDVFILKRKLRKSFVLYLKKQNKECFVKCLSSDWPARGPIGVLQKKII